ncbi:MAG: DUF2269 family protein, partial [Dehalococcoidia bacterium]
MNAEDLRAYLHLLSAFWYVGGLAAVLLPLARAWRSRDLHYQVTAFAEASKYETTLLLPGAVAAAATGVFLWAEMGFNLLTTGWLLALEIMYLVVILLCLPLIGLGLRRVHLLQPTFVQNGDSV